MAVKALITGMTGMVGSHLADFLLANTNWEIHGMQRWRSPLDNIMHFQTYHSQIKLILYYPIPHSSSNPQVYHY